MKKYLIIWLFCLIVLQVFCTTKVIRSTTKWYGESDSEIETRTTSSLNYNTTLYKYFNNLTTNFGNNETNSSCGYVALAMMLNFYDTTLNDNIVDEKYEVNAEYETNYFSVPSPGTRYETDYNPVGEDVAGYMNYLRNNYINTSLHAKLALLGTNALTSNPSNLTTFRDTFGTTKTKIENTIESYFDALPNNISYEINEITYLEDNEADIKNFIIEELELGRPVFAARGDHAIIIYGYTFSNFTYHKGYLNMCESNANWPNGVENEEKIYYALSLEITAPHVCSYHYSDNVGYGHCLCGSDIHEDHIYNNSYAYYSSNHHKAFCFCGAYRLELHNYRLDMRVEEDCACGSANPFI